ncbi:hypothetical protein AMELA_G00272910 [Ameiurus melas]|uniref:Uncharacterized protein n=1 Tax=Ameiurus melas TaxID=219545 RepID=A0A7J5ZNN2_AMEME|nr:hypothetical protein AMELA_G00272910 [Ameiurus melas]
MACNLNPMVPPSDWKSFRSLGVYSSSLDIEASSNPSINMTIDVVIRCLMVYLGESTDQLVRV